MTDTNHPTHPTELHSIEAEQAVLGALLLDASRWPDVAAIIGAEAFSTPAYARIFDTIGAAVARGEAVDPVTISEALKVAGHAQDTGGVAQLVELMNSAPGAAGAARYARIVADRARRRALLDLADELPELVRGAVDADAAVHELAGRLAALAPLQGRGGPRRLGELARQKLDELQAIAEGSELPGIPTGLAKLDAALGGGLKPGRVVVVAARPGVGKTSLALQVLLRAAAGGASCLMLSQEMQGIELAGRALSRVGAVPMDRMSGGALTHEDAEALPRAEDELARLPVWIDDQPALRLVDIAAKARDVQRRHGLQVLAVDYLQLCDTSTSAGRDAKSRHHQIEAVSRGLKTLAKELNVCVLLLSQLNRGAADEEPELFHLKESGAIEEDADAVLLLHPAGKTTDGDLAVCCKVAKNRAGRRGRLALAFDGRTQRWASSDADVSTGRRAA